MIDIAAEIQKQLKSNPNLVQDGHRVAFITHADLKERSVKAAIAVNLGKGWEVQNVFDWSHDTGVQDGINVSWSK